MGSRRWSVSPCRPAAVARITNASYAFPRWDTQVNNLQTKFASQFKSTAFANFTVAGQPAGIFKNAGTFSYVRIFGA